MSCGLKQSRWAQIWKMYGGGQEVKTQASLAGRDRTSAATSSPGRVRLVSSGPGQRLLGVPGAPLVATGMTVTSLGNIQGKRNSPLRSSVGKTRPG